MTTKLALYNSALREVGEASLATLLDGVESRRVLDAVYDDVRYEALADGPWNWATNSVKIAADTAITLAFGWQHAFSHPSDYIRTVALSADENFTEPLLDCADEGDVFFANVDPIYLKYIYSGAADPALWPQKFTRYVTVLLASRIAMRVSGNADMRLNLEKLAVRARRDALQIDQMNSPIHWPPAGSWVRSRFGAARGDRGKTSRLTG